MFFKSCVIFISLLTAVCSRLINGYNYYLLEDIPPFFTQEHFDKCNLTGNIHVPMMLSVPPPVFPCTRYLCLLKANDLLKKDFSINYDKLHTLLDDYAKKNQTDAANIQKVSQHCIGPLGSSCEADKLVHCLVITYFMGYLSGNDEMPARCNAPPPPGRKPHECCKLPPVFKQEDFDFCGFGQGDGPDGRGMADPPASYTYAGCPTDSYTTKIVPCPKDICVLNKYNLTTYDGQLKLDSVKTFINNFASENPEHREVIERVKKRCSYAIIPGPLYVCEAQKFIHCVTSWLIYECPVWESSGGCAEVRDYVHLCRRFIHSYKYATF